MRPGPPHIPTRGDSRYQAMKLWCRLGFVLPMLIQQTFILDHFCCHLSSRTCPQVYTDVITPVVLPFPRGHACLRQKNSTDRRARPRRGPPVLPEGFFSFRAGKLVASMVACVCHFLPLGILRSWPAWPGQSTGCRAHVLRPGPRTSMPGTTADASRQCNCAAD